MSDKPFIEQLRQTFLLGNPRFDIDDPLAFESLGIHLVLTCTGYANIYHLKEYRNKPWILKKDSYHDAVTHEYLPTLWNMSADGMHLALGFTHFFDVYPLSEEETRWAQNSFFSEAEVKTRRLELVKTLGEVLIDGKLSYGQLLCGELEIKHGVHLHRIQRDRHGNIRYKPLDFGVRWLRNRGLPWGNPPGWDITLDGRIVCCHLNQGEYYNYLVQPLSEEQVAYYRCKHGIPDDAVPAEKDADADLEKDRQMMDFLQRILAEVKADEKNAS